jgi:hypothetical protein
VLLSADDAVSKTLVDDHWPGSLPVAGAAGESGITGWARVAAVPASAGLVADEPGRAPASGLGLPISSAGYGTLSRDDEDDRADAGNGVEAGAAAGREAAAAEAADPEAADPEAAHPEAADSEDEADTSVDDAEEEEVADEPESQSDALHVDVSHENPSSSAASEAATGDVVTEWSASSAAVTSVTSSSAAGLGFAVFFAAEAPEDSGDPFAPGSDADDFASASAMTSSAADAVIRGGFADRPASSTPSSSVPNCCSLVAPARDYLTGGEYPDLSDNPEIPRIPIRR